MGYDKSVLPAMFKAARESKGLTQDQVGELIGMSGNGYSKIESGRNGVPIDLIWPLCDVLGISRLDAMNVVSSRNNVLDERTLCQNTILVRFHTCQSVFFSVVSPTSGRGNNGKFFYLSVSMSSLDRPSGSGQAASSSCGCSPVNMLIFPAMNPATLSAGTVRSSFNCPSYRPKVLLS